MNDPARLERLERSYRRMLIWYPAEHRRTYGEEMIGVLLASAPQGRRRPPIADVLDLLKGGLLARLRPGSSGGTGPYGAATPGSFALMFVPTIALVGLVGVLAWRSRHRGSAAS